MNSHRVLIFANPIAGRGRGRVMAGRLETELRRAPGGYEPIVFLQPPRELPPPAIAGEAHAVISIGGDGSLRSVVDLLLRASPQPPPVLVLPMGTANLMGRHLGVRWPARNVVPAVLATLAARRIVRLDAARANGQLMLVMAGVGIDAQVVQMLDAVRQGPINYASYALPVALTFASYSFPALRVSVDGQIVARDQPAIAFVGNVKEYGIGLPLLTRARPDDGLLDVCAIPCRDRRHLAELLLLVATGEHPLRDDVIYTRGTAITIEADSPVPVQIDGDSAGFTPLRLHVLPAAVPFLLPA